MVIRGGDIEPVERVVYEYRQRSYKSLRDPDMSGFSAEQISHVDSVLDRLSDMTAKAISDFSHGDYPWMAASDGEILDYEAVFCRDEHSSRSNSSSTCVWQRPEIRCRVLRFSPFLTN